MASKKILVVFGATGNQGGSVVDSMLDDPVTAKEFHIRGITRDPSKPNAKALEARGVECVAADIDNKEHIQSALKDAYAVFAMTNYWEKMDPELETNQGKSIADAARVGYHHLILRIAADNQSQEAGVQHLIWSSLLSVTELTGGKFSGVEHFDSKAAVEKYIREIGVPATFFMPGFFMSNIPGGMMRPAPPDNDWTLALPMPSDTPIPLFDSGDDTGKFVKGILQHRSEVLGKQIYGATAYYTPDQIVSIFKGVKPEAGKSAKFSQLSEEVYKGMLAGAGMPKKAQDELYENMAFMHDYGYYGKAELDESHSILDEKATTLAEFFQKAKALEGVN
ncbi:hypothetical protein MMC21_005311 [Puttea exsequens]|nr:hypothetical protein [Puttea exsequens]